MRRTSVGLRLAIIGFSAGTIGAQAVEPSPLPPPTGEHSVGRRQLSWVDESRADPDDPLRRREIVAWVWYPAVVTPGAAPAEWMPGKWAPSNVSSIRSHSYTDAPIESSSRPYPVLLFAPGAGTTPLDYSTILEDVASHGYVVLGVVSPEFARVSVFADGRVVPGSVPEQLARGGLSRASTAAVIRALEDSPFIVSKDLSFSLTQLAAVSTFRDRIDTARVGVLGHSIGGAAAEQCAHDDARVRAVFDMDGTSAWSRQNGALGKPVLVLSAAGSVGFNYAVLAGAAPGQHLRLAGTEHSFPEDVHILAFKSQTTPATVKPIPAARALRITATFIEAFFNQYLNGQREPLLSGPSADYPEVTFERGRSAQLSEAPSTTSRHRRRS